MNLLSAAGMVVQPVRGGPRLRGRIPLALGAALLAAVYVVGPVAAAQPYSEPVTASNVDTLECGTFSATLVRDFTGIVTVFFDQQGNPTKVRIVAQMRGTLTSSAGTVVDLRGAVVQVIDLVRHTYAFDGQVLMANRPGAGVVIHDTGEFLTDFNDIVLLEAGPHDVLDTFGAIFCTALL